MDPVAKTAYYCCGVRADDADRPRPICGDQLARRFMTEEGRAVFSRFARFRRPNGSNVTRARIIDDWLRKYLATDPLQPVFLVGAGFDSRAFRLGGGRWVEFDQGATIALKNELLPATETSADVTRVAVDFAVESMSEKLAPWAGTPKAVVVLEGVSEYLTQPQLGATLRVFRATFPRHDLIIDLMREDFRQKYTADFREELRRFGADFATLSDDPPRTVLEAGYEILERISIVRRARELGAISIPGVLLNTILRPLRDGYCAYRFRARE